jgi:hypothetical protein
VSFIFQNFKIIQTLSSISEKVLKSLPIYLVRPGTAPEMQTLLLFKLFMRLLLPVFGKPMMPTEIVCLMSQLRV